MTALHPFRLVVAGAAALTLLYGLYAYPLPSAPLALALAVYAAALWRWPGLWLVVIPTVLPVYDLATWTGWRVVGESDFFIVASLGVLALRIALARQDAWPRTPGRRLLLAFVGWFGVAALHGLLRSGPPGGTDNVYLSAWQTVRLALPLVYALALMPFARQRQRTNGDAAYLFGFGMVLGLAGVALAAIAERLAFPGLLNFSADYRVVGTFSSMHVGGGHIGAYIAFALPFLSVCTARGRPWSLALLAVVSVLAAYALLVTYARTAYAAALAGALVAAFGAPLAILFRDRSPRRVGSPARLIPLLVGLAVIGGGLGTVYMPERLATISADFGVRLANWTGGLTLPGQSALDRLFGNGLGSFPRLAFAGTPTDDGPSNFIRTQTPAGAVLTVQMKRQFYFGQKVAVQAGARYRLTLRGRALQPGGVNIALCEKLLLYSEHCAGAHADFTHWPAWEDFETSLIAPGTADAGWTPERLRPVELSLTSANGSIFEIAEISLRDTAGAEHVANGNFAFGLDRWSFTDDHHWLWRIFNQYLTVLFEAGVPGLLTLLALAGAAFWRAWRAMASGDIIAVCFASALTAIAVSALFDAVLEAPRLEILFYLIVLFALECGPLLQTSAQQNAVATQR